MENGILAAVTLIYVIVFERDRVHGMQFAVNERILGLCAAVDIAVTVIIVHFKAEYHAVSALIALCEKIILYQV